jgi:membrane protein DedA with SNARE-associated domain
MGVWTQAVLAAKVDMKDVGEAMFVLLVIVGAFAGIILWAKWKNKSKRKR